MDILQLFMIKISLVYSYIFVYICILLCTHINTCEILVINLSLYLFHRKYTLINYYEQICNLSFDYAVTVQDNLLKGNLCSMYHL